MNLYQKQIVAAAKGMLDYPYELGGWGGANNVPPYGIDCRGLVEMAYKMAGARDLIGGYQGNVRQMVKWAKANGRFRGPEINAQRAWPLFYYQPDAPDPEAGNLDHIRHVALKLRNPSKRYPKGLALSAINPKYDVAYHDLLLTEIYEDDGRTIKAKVNYGLAIYGSTDPDWAALPGEPPMPDPEPPLPL